jgi:hypothetical protein
MHIVHKPSNYEKVESFSYRQWFQSVYKYIFTETHVITVTTTYVVQEDITYIRADTTGGGFTVTLPTGDHFLGRKINVKKISADGNTLTIAGTGAETIDGSATQTASVQYDSFLFVANGSGWDII